jgi:hypothetical protein
MASTSGQLRATLILVSEFAAMNVLRGSDDALQCGWKSILLAQMYPQIDDRGEDGCNPGR